MGRLRFLADEHVDRAYVSALRSNGYEVVTAGEAYDVGEDDGTILSTCRERDLVLLTNDVDFVELASKRPHRGIVKYERFDHSPKEFVRGIERIDRHVPLAEFQNHVEWLENWL
jgi:predicted nuclease of predicted toxin-antitoxin system